ncbi:MAG: YciI family protein [Terriglobia bacterium]
MQYLLLIYENEKRFNQDYPDAELGEYRAFGKEFTAAIKGGNALQPTTAATTVRVRDGKPLTTDGPFAETKEQLGGYYLVEARDSKEAIAMAAKIPGARFGSVEVRPIMTFS